MKFRRIAIILTLAGIAWLGSSASAQGQQAPAAQEHGRRMEGLAAIGPGLLHDHMEAMIKQLSASLKQMAAMIGSARMDAEQMRRTGALMTDLADMLGEMPAIEARGRQTPDLAMRDMSVMMTRLGDLLQQVAELQSAMK